MKIHLSNPNSLDSKLALEEQKEEPKESPFKSLGSISRDASVQDASAKKKIPESTDDDTAALRDQIERLQKLVQQRDKEIEILVQVVEKNKNSGKFQLSFLIFSEEQEVPPEKSDQDGQSELVENQVPVPFPHPQRALHPTKSGAKSRTEGDREPGKRKK